MYTHTLWRVIYVCNSELVCMKSKQFVKVTILGFVLHWLLNHKAED